MPKRHAALLAAVGLIVAALGVTEYTDGIVRYVTGIVDQIAWWDLWRPVFDPPPMNTYTYRPLTVATAKILLFVTGRDPVWMTALHSLTVVWFGFAVHRFLRTHGMEAVALPAAISTIVLPSLLFSSWIPVESDTMGAAFLCEAGWALQTYRVHGRRKHFWLFVAFAFGAATTKETSAAAGFGYLVAFAIAYRKEDFARWAKFALGYGVALFVLVLPLLLATSQEPHAFHVRSEEFHFQRVIYFLGHNAAQLFYLVGAGGVALIAVRVRPSRAAALAALALLVAAPPLRVYNHYESVIVDQWHYVAICFGIAFVALLWTALKDPEPAVQAAVLTLGALFAVLAIAPLLALQSRPDVSARLYAPAAPILHALAWDGARRLRAVLRDQGWQSRALGGLVIATWVLFPIFNSVSGIAMWRARMGVEKEAKTALAELLQREHVGCPFIIAVNRNHELAVEELEALGVRWTHCSALFVPNRIQLDPGPQDFDKWRIQGHTYSLRETDTQPIEDRLRARLAPDRCVYLYLQTPRTLMETSDHRRFSGDFAWAFDNLPEFNEEAHEQQLEIRFRERTGYEQIFGEAGAMDVHVYSDFIQLPTNPNELVQRLVLGLPYIEFFRYEGRVMAFEKCRDPVFADPEDPPGSAATP